MQGEISWTYKNMVKLLYLKIMVTYNRSLVFIFGAVAYHLDDKVKPIDINFVHFLFIHRIDEEIEEPQLNFFDFNPKNCLEPSLYRVFVHI